MKAQDRIRKLLEKEGYTDMGSDINLDYGGTWCKPGDVNKSTGIPYWYDFVVITDLDGVCGAEGQLLIESKNTSFDYQPNDHNRFVDSVECCGDKSTLAEIARKDKAEARMVLATWLMEYGISDPNGYGSGYWVAVLDRKAERDSTKKWLNNRVSGYGWKAVESAVLEAIRA